MSILRDMLKENNQKDSKDRWNIWKSHRETIRDLQEKNIFLKGKDIDTAIVLGAGACEDLDLNYLCGKLSKLTLVDIDLEAMKTGVGEQNLSKEAYGKIEFIGDIDFTGLEDTNFYDELETLFKNGEKPKKILKLIMTSVEMIENKDLFNNETYGLVISGAVHSQLTSVAVDLLDKYCENYKKKELKKIHKDLIYIDDIIALKYNDLIMSLTKEDGTIFSWFDLKEFSKDLDNYDQVEAIDKACQEGDSEKAIKMVTENRYVGFHGYLDLNKRALEKELKTKPWVNFWIWHYNNEKSYLVFSITIDLSDQ